MIKSENKIVSIIIGLIILFLGFWILSRPFITLFSISIFLALAVLFRGLYLVYSFFRRKNEETKWGELVSGGVFSVLGLVLLAYPGLSATIILYLLSLWFIIDGLSTIKQASLIGSNWKYVAYALSVLLVLFGISLIFEPIRAVFTLNILVGISIITDGLHTIFNAFWLDKDNTLS